MYIERQSMMLHVKALNLVVSRTVRVKSWSHMFVSKSGLSGWLFPFSSSLAVVVPSNHARNVLFKPDGPFCSHKARSSFRSKPVLRHLMCQQCVPIKSPQGFVHSFQTSNFSLALMLSGRRGTQPFHIDHDEVANKMKALRVAFLCHKILAYAG